MTFAERLRQLREKAGLTQEALARDSGLSGGGVRNYEQGIREPSFTALLKLVRGLGAKSLGVFDGVEIGDGAEKSKPGRPRRGGG